MMPTMPSVIPLLTIHLHHSSRDHSVVANGNHLCGRYLTSCHVLPGSLIRWRMSACEGCHGGWAHTFGKNEVLITIPAEKGAAVPLPLNAGVGRAKQALELKHARKRSVPCWFIIMHVCFLCARQNDCLRALLGPVL